MKFNIGDDVFWVESHCHYQKTIPCPMCFGKKFVTVILGDDSKVQTACGFCEREMEGSTGYATIWEPTAIIKSGQITGVSTKDGIKYEVNYNSLSEDEILTSQDAANAEYLFKLEEVKKQAQKWFNDSFVNCTKKQVWSAGYHKRCIEQAERTIEWHKAKLGMIKQNPAASEGEKG